MARNDRKRSRQWHFSDSGSRFDTRRLYRPTIDHDPISKTFARKIVYCRRCRNRVVSNVRHCPFCGKNLQPFYRRFWFWFLIVWLISSATISLVIYSLRIEPAETPHEIPPPAVVGAPAGASIKDLTMDTTVDCNQLLVTVLETLPGPTASDGKPITAVRVRFVNAGTDEIMLLSTQWRLGTASGERIDCFIGKTEDGDNIASDLDSANLPAGATLTVTLYFAAEAPTTILFAPNALSYGEEDLVTWLLPPPPDNPPEVPTS